MARRGTLVQIDLDELEKLCALQCTDEEIASWFGVNARTISRRRKVQSFADVMDRGKAKGRISIRRMQMKLLEQGNATMGVWLGKQVLGQTDQFSVGVNHGIHVVLPAAHVLDRASRGAEDVSQVIDITPDPPWISRE